MKSVLLSITLFLFAGFANAQSGPNVNGMTDEEFGAAVREYILSNPEVIAEAITILQQNQRAAETQNDVDLVQTFSEELFYDGFSHIAGNPDGEILMVEFQDYKCSYCKKAHAEVQALLAANPDIRLVVKEYPILGPESVLASRAAVAVLVNDGPQTYAIFNDALMTHNGPVNENTLTQLASASGADGAAMMGMINDPIVTQVMQKNRLLGQRMAVNGTPTFVLGEQMLRGYVPLPQMQMLVDQLRASLE